MGDGHGDLAGLTERVTELEIRAAYEIRAIEDLDRVLRDVADRLDRLERAFGELQATLVSPPGGAPDPAAPRGSGGLD
jgi:uncharacterized coiled-coil protein SlyX